MYNLASVPLIPLLVLARAIYYLICLLYIWVEYIIPIMNHVSNQNNWKQTQIYILYGEKRFKSFLVFCRVQTDLKIMGISQSNPWWTPLKPLDTPTTGITSFNAYKYVLIYMDISIQPFSAGPNSCLVSYLEKLLFPIKKRLFEIPRVRLIDNSSNICPNDPEWTYIR